VLILGTAALALAQDQPAVPPPFKIGTIFAQNAIVSTQEGQKAAAAITAKYAPKKEEFDRKQAEITALRDQLKKNMATMTAQSRDKLNQMIDARSKELKRLGEDTEAAVTEEEAALVEQLGKKLMAVIDTYAQQNGYAVVLDVSAPEGPVLWAAASADITNEVVKLYDRTYPVTATAAAPAAKK